MVKITTIANALALSSFALARPSSAGEAIKACDFCSDKVKPAPRLDERSTNATVRIAEESKDGDAINPVDVLVVETAKGVMIALKNMTVADTEVKPLQKKADSIAPLFIIPSFTTVTFSKATNSPANQKLIERTVPGCPEGYYDGCALLTCGCYKDGADPGYEVTPVDPDPPGQTGTRESMHCAADQHVRCYAEPDSCFCDLGPAYFDVDMPVPQDKLAHPEYALGESFDGE